MIPYPGSTGYHCAAVFFIFMAHVSNQISSDFADEQLPSSATIHARRENTSCIQTIVGKYKSTKDIHRTINEIESLSDFELLTYIYERVLQRAPMDSEAVDKRVDAIREHILLQLSEVYLHSQQALLRLLSQLQFDSNLLVGEERKNSHLKNVLLELLSSVKKHPQSDGIEPFFQYLDHLQDAYERHVFYNQIATPAIDSSPRDESVPCRSISEVYWSRKLGVSGEQFRQLVQEYPSFITLCEHMNERRLPVELLPARFNWLHTNGGIESNEVWLAALEEYYRILLPLERHAVLLDPIHNRSNFTNSAGIQAQVELLESRREDPNWLTVLSCNILYEEGVKLLKRQRSLAHLALEISKLVSEDYYGALVATGMKHNQSLLPLVPINTQRGFDSAVDVLRAQQLLKREYFSAPQSNKVSHLFSSGGKDHIMWKSLLNLVVALERGIDSFEAALSELKQSSERSPAKSLHHNNFPKYFRNVLQDALTTLRIFTYQVVEDGKSSEYQSQIGTLKQSLSKIPLEAVEESMRGGFELCKNYFFLPFSNSLDLEEIRNYQVVLAQLIAIMRRSCEP